VELLSGEKVALLGEQADGIARFLKRKRNSWQVVKTAGAINYEKYFL
jgi:hypothetical protein